MVIQALHQSSQSAPISPPQPDGPFQQRSLQVMSGRSSLSSARSKPGFFNKFPSFIKTPINWLIATIQSGFSRIMVLIFGKPTRPKPPQASSRRKPSAHSAPARSAVPRNIDAAHLLKTDPRKLAKEYKLDTPQVQEALVDAFIQNPIEMMTLFKNPQKGGVFMKGLSRLEQSKIWWGIDHFSFFPIKVYKNPKNAMAMLKGHPEAIEAYKEMKKVEIEFLKSFGSALVQFSQWMSAKLQAATLKNPRNKTAQANFTALKNLFEHALPALGQKMNQSPNVCQNFWNALLNTSQQSRPDYAVVLGKLPKKCHKEYFLYFLEKKSKVVLKLLLFDDDNRHNLRLIPPDLNTSREEIYATFFNFVLTSTTIPTLEGLVKIFDKEHHPFAKIAMDKLLASAKESSKDFKGLAENFSKVLKIYSEG